MLILASGCVSLDRPASLADAAAAAADGPAPVDGPAIGMDAHLGDAPAGPADSDALPTGIADAAMAPRDAGADAASCVPASADWAAGEILGFGAAQNGLGVLVYKAPSGDVWAKVGDASSTDPSPLWLSAAGGNVRLVSMPNPAGVLASLNELSGGWDRVRLLAIDASSRTMQDVNIGVAGRHYTRAAIAYRGTELGLLYHGETTSATGPSTYAVTLERRSGLTATPTRTTGTPDFRPIDAVATSHGYLVPSSYGTTSSLYVFKADGTFEGKRFDYNPSMLVRFVSGAPVPTLARALTGGIDLLPLNPEGTPGTPRSLRASSSAVITQISAVQTTNGAAVAWVEANTARTLLETAQGVVPLETLAGATHGAWLASGGGTLLRAVNLGTSVRVQRLCPP